MNNYKSLEIWKLAKSLVPEIYNLLKNFPKDELYSITNQIKRCCISIPANIAEGSGRNSPKEFLQFLSISNASSTELDTLLDICVDLEYITREEYSDLNYKIDRIQKMNRKLQISIKTKYNI